MLMDIQGRRERSLHRREPDLRHVRFRPRHGRERRLVQQAHTEGWLPQVRLERFPVNECGMMGVRPTPTAVNMEAH